MLIPDSNRSFTVSRAIAIVAIYASILGSVFFIDI